MPRPSQPNNKSIVWGNKIRNIIDNTNKRTKIVNRSVVLSFSMYVFANCITLVAIVRTVDIKIMLAGSIMMGKTIYELLKAIMSHSINVDVH
jgi:hypothetical protein